MPPVTARAIILQAFPYSDTSKVLRLYCRDQGLHSVIAKGASRPKSRFGGILEPFTEGDAHFLLKESRDLHTLTDFDLVRSRQELGRDFAAFAGASVMAEVVLRCSTPEPFPALFASLQRSLDALACKHPDDSSVRALIGIWQIVALLGFEPEMEHCVGCGRELDATETVRFDVDAGGASCLTCRPAGRLVDAATRAEIRDMTRSLENQPTLGDRGLHRALLRVFLSTHLSLDRPLKSLGLFLDELDRPA